MRGSRDCPRQPGAGGRHRVLTRKPCRAWSSRSRRLTSGRGAHFPSGADFGLTANSPASQSRILVAVPPAVHGSLNQSSLPSQAGVQVCQRPSHLVAIGFVVQAITLVLLLGHRSSWVDAILRLELAGQSIGVYRFNITPNRILHLDAVPRVFKSDPLHARCVLLHHKWSSRRNRTRSGIRTGWWSLLRLRCLEIRVGRRRSVLLILL